MRRATPFLCGCLALASVLHAQAEDVLGRLQQYQQQYDRWASQHTFVWEIEYSESNNMAALQELPAKKEPGNQAVRIQSPAYRSFVARLTIARTPELSMVMIERVSGDWFHGYGNALRIYKSKDWMIKEGGEARDMHTDQTIQTVYVTPSPQRTGVLLDSLSFAPLLHPAFFAGTNAFEPGFECTRSEWLLEKATDSQIILKQPFGADDRDPGRYYLILHPKGWVQEHQIRLNSSTIRNRIAVLGVQQHSQFTVPSEVRVELRSNLQQARLVARLVRLEKTKAIKIEYPFGAQVSDYRLMQADEWCAARSKTTAKVVNYLWKGQLPTLKELEQMYRANSPTAGIPIPPARQGRWWIYLPGIILIVVGVYLWWRNRRVTTMG